MKIGVIPVFMFALCSQSWATTIKTSTNYPAEALAKCIEGFVEVAYDVSKDGVTSNIKITKSDPPGVFDEAAMESVRSQKLIPISHEGVPVSVKGMTMKKNYELDRGSYPQCEGM